MAALGFVQAAPAAEQVTSIPGYPAFTNFQMYSGYSPINGTSKEVHYMLLTSQNDPVNDPLVIWFNGGPGCSSMLAWAQEHGPFLQSNTDMTFAENPYSWNKFANMLYIEQPAGVGYSYCDVKNHPEDCKHDDNSIAKDNLRAILNWFEKYPEFKSNELYISGESYGGIYVPYTSNAIYHHNQIAKTTGEFQPNLKGFMVGNGVTNWKYDTSPAYLKMGFWHSLIDQKTYNAMTEQKCDFSQLSFDITPSKACMDLFDKFNKGVEKVNIYNIFGYCYGLKEGDEGYAAANELGIYTVGGQIKTYKKGLTAKDYTPWAWHGDLRAASGLKETPPCVNGQFIIKFLNDPAVRQALHIPDKI